MGLTDFGRVIAHAIREDGLRAGAYTAGREAWHSWRRLYHNGELVHRIKWHLPHGDPVITARQYHATIPAENFTEYHTADVHGEKHLIHEFMRFVEPTDIFWDVGANIGLWSVLVGQAAGHTYSFEPDGRVFGNLRKNLRANDIDATPVSVGLSDSDRTEQLFVNDRWGVGGIEADLLRAEQLWRQGFPLPDVMKMDIEGAEAAALAGFGEQLADVRHILVEVHPGREPDGYAEGDVRELLDRTHETQIVYERGSEYHLEAVRRD